MINHSRRRPGFTMRVLVTLQCGCRIRMRNYPLNTAARFVCTLGKSHGYQLPWLSWEDEERGTRSINPATNQETTA